MWTNSPILPFDIDVANRHNLSIPSDLHHRVLPILPSEPLRPLVQIIRRHHVPSLVPIAVRFPLASVVALIRFFASAASLKVEVVVPPPEDLFNSTAE